MLPYLRKYIVVLLLAFSYSYGNQLPSHIQSAIAMSPNEEWVICKMTGANNKGNGRVLILTNKRLIQCYSKAGFTTVISGYLKNVSMYRLVHMDFVFLLGLAMISFLVGLVVGLVLGRMAIGIVVGSLFALFWIVVYYFSKGTELIIYFQGGDPITHRIMGQDLKEAQKFVLAVNRKVEDCYRK